MKHSEPELEVWERINRLILYEGRDERLRDCTDDALYESRIKGALCSDDVPKYIALAEEKLNELLTADADCDDSLAVSGEVTGERDDPPLYMKDGDAPFASLMTLRTIEGRIADLRRQTFGREDVPFQAWTDAVEWIRNTAAEAEKPTLEDRERAAKLTRRIENLATQIEELLPGVGCDIEYSERTLRFPVDDGHEKYEEYTVSWSLAGLAARCASLSKATGFEQLAVLRYVLVGEKPTLPRYSVTFQPGNRGGHLHTTFGNKHSPNFRPGGGTITVQFFSPDITHQELRKLHVDIQSVAEGYPDPSEELLLELLREFGPPPRNWSAMMEAWNRRAGEYGIKKRGSSD